MKKFSLLSVSFMVLFTVSSVPAANAAITVKGDKPIYPAVYQAILNGQKTVWSESKIANITDPNIVVINNVRTNDRLNIADFTLQISVENNVVKYRFYDIKEKTLLSTTWTNRNEFAAKNTVEKSFTDFFDAEISKVMANENLYAQAKQTADRQNWAPRVVSAPAATPTTADQELNFSLPLQNPQNYLLYPAVGAAFTNIKGSLGVKTAYLRDIDCLDNKFTIQRCVARRPRDLIAYQIKLAYKDNQLTVEFTNIEPNGSSLMQYMMSDNDLESLPSFDTQKITDQLKTQIEQSLANANVYNSAKKAFLENNAFLRQAFIPITQVLMDEFTATLFKDGDISLSVSILDVKKNEKAEFKNYSIEISAGLYTEPSTSGAFAYITLYTNDAGLARLKQYENTTLSGKFVRMEYSNIVTPNFIMTK